MKRTSSILILVSVFCVACLASPANANMVGTVEISAGYAKNSAEIGTSGESMGGGLSFGAAFWRPISPLVSWGAEVSYDNLGTAEAATYDPFTATTYNEEFTTKVLRVNPALRVNLGSGVGPSFYAQGGAGLYNVSWDYTIDDGVSEASLDDGSSEFGFNLGAGVGFPVGPKTKLNLSGSYHIVPSADDLDLDDTNNMQFRAGIGFGL